MEAVIFVGLQGSGKSTFYHKHFAQTHARISLDLQKTRLREESCLKELLHKRQSFVVDNTNPTARDRQRYIAPAKAAGYTVIGYYFDVPITECLKRNALRSGKGRIPAVGLYATRKRMQPPTPAEGFNQLFIVRVQNDDFECSPMPVPPEGNLFPRGIP